MRSISFWLVLLTCLTEVTQVDMTLYCVLWTLSVSRFQLIAKYFAYPPLPVCLSVLEGNVVYCANRNREGVIKSVESIFL